MALCDYSAITKEKPLNPCPALPGVGADVYVGNTSDILSYTRDATSKNILTLVMKPTKRLWKFAGRIKSNSANGEFQGGDNGTTFLQSYTLITDYITQLEMDALEDLCKARDLFVIFLENRGTYKAIGLNKDPDRRDIYPGVNVVTATFPTGVVAGDLTAATITLQGALENNAVVFQVVAGTVAATKAYLEAAMTPAA